MIKIARNGLAIVGALTVVTGTLWLGLTYFGLVSVEKLRSLIKYNPLYAASVPVYSERSIETSLLRLGEVSYSLPGLNGNFISGGGAIESVGNGVLIAGRDGSFFQFSNQNGTPALQPVASHIDTNERGYETYAESQGYDIMPGRNVGYAGLGMRLHDLLILRDSGQILASVTKWDGSSSCARLHVLLATFSDAMPVPKIGEWESVFETSPCMTLSENKEKPFAGHQAGGRMIELSDTKILLTVGDFKNDGVKRNLNVADMANDYGKIHELDLVAKTSRIYSIGHRNPQGLLMDRLGRIWSTEHGPSGGDEINLISRGMNYGWPHVTLGIDCNGCAWQIEGRHDGYEAPIFSYLPSIGISNLVQLKNVSAVWDGDLLVASLRGEALHRLRLQGNAVMYDEVISIGDRIRDVLQLRDGRIALWTDSGQLKFLSVSRDKSHSDKLLELMSQQTKEVLRQCQACHSFDPGQPIRDKISLWEIMGRSRATAKDATYSKAMQKIGGIWTTDELDRFLADPQGYIPGTSMSFAGLNNSTQRAEIVDFLAKLR